MPLIFVERLSQFAPFFLGITQNILGAHLLSCTICHGSNIQLQVVSKGFSSPSNAEQNTM